MPDLDQLLETLVADVAAGTRAPGAQGAITQARRRRAAGAVVAAMVCGAVGGGLVVGTRDDSGLQTPTDEPTSGLSESPTGQESPPPGSFDALGTELDALLGQVPGWTISSDRPDGYDYAFNGPCSGNWWKGSTAGGDGSAPGISWVGMGHHGFPSEARAVEATASFIENLDSCSVTEWRMQPIVGTGAVLASSADAVVWIQRTGDTVDILQVLTVDGPPPEGVQAEVAEWVVDYRTWQEEN